MANLKKEGGGLVAHAMNWEQKKRVLNSTTGAVLVLD